MPSAEMGLIAFLAGVVAGAIIMRLYHAKALAELKRLRAAAKRAVTKDVGELESKL
jgi:uncharacterized membrane-anchored protein YhcB (DUF1043 family)